MKLVRESLETEPSKHVLITFHEDGGRVLANASFPLTDEELMEYMSVPRKKQLGYFVVDDQDKVYQIREYFEWTPVSRFDYKFQYIGRKLGIRMHSPYNTTDERF